MHTSLLPRTFSKSWPDPVFIFIGLQRLMGTRSMTLHLVYAFFALSFWEEFSHYHGAHHHFIRQCQSQSFLLVATEFIWMSTIAMIVWFKGFSQLAHFIISRRPLSISRSMIENLQPINTIVGFIDTSTQYQQSEPCQQDESFHLYYLNIQIWGVDNL